MDANGTRYHLVLGEPDWLRCQDGDGTALADSFKAGLASCGPEGEGLAWDAARNELTLRPCAFVFPAASADTPPRLEDRRGTGRDVYGNAYWVAAGRTEVRVKSAGSGVVSHFWSVGDGLLCQREEHFGDFQKCQEPAPPGVAALSGLAVTEDHYLFVGVVDPRGFLVFDLHAGGPPRQVCWPTSVPFSPFDVTARPTGGVFVLDRTARRLWELDRRFEVLSGVPLAVSPSGAFRSLGDCGTPPCPGIPILTLDAASLLDALDPIAVEALPDGTVLVLDRGATVSRLERYRGGLRVAQVALDMLPAQAHDMAFRPRASNDPDALLGRLDLVDAKGNQAFAFLLEQDGDAITLERIDEYLPLRLFGGKGLLAGSGLVYYDLEDDFLPLVAQRRPRYARRATVVTPAFDGRDPSCVWHRLMIDAVLPPATEMQVLSRAANERAGLEVAPWRREPTPRRRRTGSELPFLPEPAGDCAGTWETLFQDARGRYLQLKLELRGNGRATPRLRGLRAYYPRFSYLQRYLPGVYREDAAPASFLERFLANVEGFFTSIEDRIAAAQVLMDVEAAPADALPWLADWYGIALDPTWSPAQRRLFLRHAMLFFQYRGTVRGLEMALALALCDDPDESIFDETRTARANGVRVVERFRTRRVPGVALGDPTDVSGIRQGLVTARWKPAEGGHRLRERYAQFLASPTATKPAAGPLPVFPLSPPSGTAAPWRDFCLYHLGFVPQGAAADRQAWQDFLARRYRRVGALNEAHAGRPALTDFSEARPFGALPPDGPPLADWYEFESVALAMRRLAHQFRVLIPARHEDTVLPLARHERLAQVERVIDLEKPAHTVFDVKFYWALFRLGEARLGLDTLAHLGGRSPDLLRPLVLGDAHLAESYLAPAHPQDVTDRMILGRERLASAPTGVPL